MGDGRSIAPPKRGFGPREKGGLWGDGAGDDLPAAVNFHAGDGGDPFAWVHPPIGGGTAIPLEEEMAIVAEADHAVWGEARLTAE